VTLPGPYEGHSLWRTINVPQDDADKTVLLVQDMDRPFNAYVNGTLVQYSGIPSSGSHLQLNITPYLHFGQDNRIQLVSMYNKGSIGRLALDLYEPGTFP
jgi:beta-galactosidase/beta-glucuronidase